MSPFWANIRLKWSSSAEITYVTYQKPHQVVWPGERRAYAKMQGFTAEEEGEHVVKTDENPLWPQLDVEEHGLKYVSHLPQSWQLKGHV